MADGVVVGTVGVVGPVPRVSMPGDPTYLPDSIAGLAAREVVYPGMGDALFHRWVVTGPSGDEWEVVTTGLAVTRARRWRRPLAIGPTRVDYAESGDATVSQLYRRAGAPYPRRSSAGSSGPCASSTTTAGSARSRCSDALSASHWQPPSSARARGSALSTTARPMENPVTPRRHILQVEVQPGVVASAAGLGDDAAVLQAHCSRHSSTCRRPTPGSAAPSTRCTADDTSLQRATTSVTGIDESAGRGTRRAAGDELGAQRGDHGAVVGAQPRPRHAQGDARRVAALLRDHAAAVSWPPLRRRSAGGRRRARRRPAPPCGSARRRPPPGSDAATSATGTGSPSRSRASTQRATAVFRPENEKS